jgi:hypothetical protein
VSPEETIRAALERLKRIPSRHGGVPTFPAFAALDALVAERDELRRRLEALGQRVERREFLSPPEERSERPLGRVSRLARRRAQGAAG